MDLANIAYYHDGHRHKLIIDIEDVEDVFYEKVKTFLIQY